MSLHKTIPSDSGQETEEFFEQFHRRPYVKAKYGNISDATLYRWISLKRFPAPVKLGPGTVAWRESTLREYDQNPEAWQGL